MIYLKPVGGLCNRMRAIDSTISLCKENNCNLTILWIKNQDLNCSFEKIFKELKEENVSIQIKEFSGNLVEYYTSKALLYRRKKFGLFKYIKYHLKRCLRNNNLDIYTTILLWKIKESNFVLNKNLMDIYNSCNTSNESINDMDNSFMLKIEPNLKELFHNNKKKVFIESCFRIHPIKDDLSIFKPNSNLKVKIEKITSKFNNTIGIHIRRTDHLSSINKSRTSSFITVMEDALGKNKDVTFFLATDDNTVKKQLIKKFNNKIITNDVKSYDRNQVNSIEDALIDLYSLSKTEKILGSYHSTFSQTSAIIGNIDFITVL